LLGRFEEHIDVGYVLLAEEMGVLFGDGRGKYGSFLAFVGIVGLIDLDRNLFRGLDDNDRFIHSRFLSLDGRLHISL
jgi:hypothetical protein